MLDWLIIGGGIHGTYLSLYLTQRKGIPPERLRVLDPQPQPLALWKQFTSNCGMEYLRSSHAHNLHFDPFSLVTFTRTQQGQPLARFIEPYGRPSLELFNAHCDHVIDRYKLDTLRLVGRAQGLTHTADGWRIESDQGSLEARNAIVAFGNTERPVWPEWAQAARQTGAPIYHLFDTAFERHQLVADVDTVVVGGGITAAQCALSLAVQSPGKVTLLTRHTPRLHQFDADLGWITHQYLDSFHAEADNSRRRAMIQNARHRGSMPADVAREFQRALELNLLVQRMDEVVSVERYKDVGTAFLPSAASLALHLASGDRLETRQLVLATGFESSRPGGAWLDEAIGQYEFPRAPDGYPIVDECLRWSAGLYVCGSLAELEIGPVARNFIGAKLAAERIGAVV
ncbi:MAG: FAD/NAD(P)-binding protein [Anaerolineae bacterium]